MLNENAKKWVEALRSGKYKQGKYCLSQNGKYCCLGVACELAVENGLNLQVSTSTCGQTMYGTDNKILPSSVMGWLGLSNQKGHYYANGRGDYLAGQNDGGLTFNQIADIIESEPEGLFNEPKM